jgi:hypothetical protein
MMIQFSVGNNLTNDPDDILNVKSHFSKLGLYKNDLGLHSPFMDFELDNAIKRFQNNHDLKVDGKINPKGETENFLKIKLSGSPIIRCPKCGAPHGGSKGAYCPDCVVKM